MSGVLRHIGKTANTDRRLVVVYMQIPDREDHALVVDTDSLPSKYHDDLMQLVQGEGQKTTVLADLLQRRIMPSTGLDILTTLHHAGQLQAVPAANVIMMPYPNQGIPLPKILEVMKGEPAPEAEIEHTENRIIENQNIEKYDAQESIAKNLLIEADMLAAEAHAKREKAYSMVPALRPKAPKVNQEQVTEIPTTDIAPKTRAKKVSSK